MHTETWHQSMKKTMLSLPNWIRPGNNMRTTVTLDDKLLEDASAAMQNRSRSAVLNEALRALIQRDAARRLARLGGSDPAARAGPRRQADPAHT